MSTYELKTILLNWFENRGGLNSNLLDVVENPAIRQDWDTLSKSVTIYRKLKMRTTTINPHLQDVARLTEELSYGRGLIDKIVQTALTNKLIREHTPTPLDF